MDRPLLVLAVVTMVLYLLDLRGMLGLGPARSLRADRSLIDSVFVFDLVLKLVPSGPTTSGPPGS